MATAGRATLFSGVTVAIGLALLVFMPLPFMRSMGVGGLLVPLVSIAASATLLPALLAMMGRGVNRWRIIPRRVLERRAAADATGFWHRLATSIMRRPVLWFCAAGGLMLALALPALGLAADRRRQPRRAADHRGDARPARARDDARPGRARAAPDRDRHAHGRAARTTPPCVAAERRLVAELRADPRDRSPRTIAGARVLVPAARSRRQANLVDADGPRAADPRRGPHRRRHAARRWTSSTASATATCPPRASPPATDVAADRRAGVRRRLHRQGLRRVPVARARRARRLLPAAAARVPLGRAAAQGGAHEPAVGQRRPTACSCSSSSTAGASRRAAAVAADRGWIPIFLFAMLFGLSMDYEVFLLSRMREEWERRHDNERGGRLRARAHRAHHHGRGDHHDRGVLGLHGRAASSACRSSGSGCRRRSCSTRPSCARSSCRRR